VCSELFGGYLDSFDMSVGEVRETSATGEQVDFQVELLIDGADVPDVPDVPDAFFSSVSVVPVGEAWKVDADSWMVDEEGDAGGDTSGDTAGDTADDAEGDRSLEDEGDRDTGPGPWEPEEAVRAYREEQCPEGAEGIDSPEAFICQVLAEVDSEDPWEIITLVEMQSDDLFREHGNSLGWTPFDLAPALNEFEQYDY
jgi:hypothetical protein